VLGGEGEVMLRCFERGEGSGFVEFDLKLFCKT